MVTKRHLIPVFTAVHLCALQNVVEVPLVGAGTIPHRSEAWFKAAGVVLQPAAEGTGVIAGEYHPPFCWLSKCQSVLILLYSSRVTQHGQCTCMRCWCCSQQLRVLC